MKRLEKPLKFLCPPKTISLADWAIGEGDETRSEQYVEYVVWDGPLFFDAVSCTIERRSAVVAGQQHNDSNSPISQILNEARIIRFELGFASCDGRRGLDADVKLSMFGTDRRIADIQLAVYSSGSKDSNASCVAFGFPAFQSTAVDEMFPDEIEFRLALPSRAIDDLIQTIESGNVKEVKFRAAMIEGAYSRWSPDHHTSILKFLTTFPEHDLSLESELEDVVSRMSSVGDAEISVMTTFTFQSENDASPGTSKRFGLFRRKL